MPTHINSTFGFTRIESVLVVVFMCLQDKLLAWGPGCPDEVLKKYLVS